MGMRRDWPATLAGALCIVVCFGAPASAAWVAGAQGSAGAAAHTLAPAGSPTLTQSCLVAPVPTYLSATTTSVSGGGAVTPARPAGVQQGDVILAVLGFGGTGYVSAPQPTPSGWNKVRQDDGDKNGQAVFTRLATGSEPTTYNFGTAASDAVVLLAAYAGVDPITPVNASSGAARTPSFGLVAPGVTTTRPNSRLVAAYGISVIAGISPPTGMTERAELGLSKLTVEIADEANAGTGGTGTRTATATTDVSHVAQLLALQPPLQPHISASWTASPSTYTTGYRYQRYQGGALQNEQLTDASTLTAGPDGPLANNTTYTFRTVATAQNWRSQASATTITTAC